MPCGRQEMAIRFLLKGRTAPMKLRHATPAERPSKGAVLTKAALKAAERLQVANSALAKVLGVSPSQVTRIRQGTVSLEPGNKPYQLAALFVRVYRSLDAITGGDDAVSAQWLESYNAALKGKPLDLIQDVAGLTNVIQYLDTRRAVI
jgi:transcriptional regulator with XRE-family HTH domain